jgi:hypothetical protein
VRTKVSGRIFVTFFTAWAIELASEARADAPVGQYAVFDQHDPVISDLGTRLHWQRGFAQVTDYWGALAYCQGLSLPSYPSGWRVPSYKELLTLVDEQPHTEFWTGVPTQVAVDRNAFGANPSFGGTPGAPFWSSSLSPATSSVARAYIVNFSDGAVSADPLLTPTYFVRCVQP